VNSINSILVEAHIDALLAEAAAERLARSVKTASVRPNRIAAALKSVWSSFAGPAGEPGLPTLADYPYRG
jgi:hypothetical protein